MGEERKAPPVRQIVTPVMMVDFPPDGVARWPNRLHTGDTCSEEDCLVIRRRFEGDVVEVHSHGDPGDAMASIDREVELRRRAKAGEHVVDG